MPITTAAWRGGGWEGARWGAGVVVGWRAAQGGKQSVLEAMKAHGEQVRPCSGVEVSLPWGVGQQRARVALTRK